MAENTKIAWADSTFNPWIGCTKIKYAKNPESECDRCYADSVSTRYKLAEWGPGKPRKRTSEKYWKDPFRWNARAKKSGVPERVFCASMADVFDGEVSDEWRFDLFDLIAATPNLIWLILSKRDPRPFVKRFIEKRGIESVPTNIWWGFSAGHQEALEGRWPWYVGLASILPYMPLIWVSAEPLLGPLDLTGKAFPSKEGKAWNVPAINWVIVGGESGAGSREMLEEYVEKIMLFCESVGVPFFFKQLGEVWAKRIGVKGKGDKIEDIPNRFMVRQHPEWIKEAA